MAVDPFEQESRGRVSPEVEGLRSRRRGYRRIRRDPKVNYDQVTDGIGVFKDYLSKESSEAKRNLAMAQSLQETRVVNEMDRLANTVYEDLFKLEGLNAVNAGTKYRKEHEANAQNILNGLSDEAKKRVTPLIERSLIDFNATVSKKTNSELKKYKDSEEQTRLKNETGKASNAALIGHWKTAGNHIREAGQLIYNASLDDGDDKEVATIKAHRGQSKIAFESVRLAFFTRKFDRMMEIYKTFRDPNKKNGWPGMTAVDRIEVEKMLSQTEDLQREDIVSKATEDLIQNGNADSISSINKAIKNYKGDAKAKRMLKSNLSHHYTMKKQQEKEEIEQSYDKAGAWVDDTLKSGKLSLKAGQNYLNKNATASKWSISHRRGFMDYVKRKLTKKDRKTNPDAWAKAWDMYLYDYPKFRSENWEAHRLNPKSGLSDKSINMLLSLQQKERPVNLQRQVYNSMVEEIGLSDAPEEVKAHQLKALLDLDSSKELANPETLRNFRKELEETEGGLESEEGFFEKWVPFYGRSDKRIEVDKAREIHLRKIRARYPSTRAILDSDDNNKKMLLMDYIHNYITKYERYPQYETVKKYMQKEFGGS